MPNLVCENPLRWPKSQKRTENPKPSKFNDPSVAKALKQIEYELERMKAVSIQISADLPVGRSGLFLSNYNRQDDNAVVVTWTMKDGKTYTIANDNFDTPQDNLWGIALSIEAMRGLSRWGGDRLVTMAFSGAAALPPSAKSVNPFDGLTTKTTIESKYRELAKRHHPDHGGSTEKMATLNGQREEALKRLESATGGS